MQEKLKGFLAIFATYLTIAGLVTFSQFILEEAFQTIMFSTWAAQDANRWDIVHDSTELMQTSLTTLKVVTYTIGWIQPLGFISYLSYAQAEDRYIKSLRAKVLANAPELFIGKRVEYSASPKSWETIGNFYVTNGRIRIISKTKPEPSMRVSGILMSSGNRLYIRQD